MVPFSFPHSLSLLLNTPPKKKQPSFSFIMKNYKVTDIKEMYLNNFLTL